MTFAFQALLGLSAAVLHRSVQSQGRALVSSSSGSSVGSVRGASAALVGDDPGHVHAQPRYPEYHHTVTPLDGYWRYSFSESAYPTEAKGTTWIPEALPSKNESSPARGFALLEREISVKENGRLQFYGCAFRCRVEIDGKVAGTHSGGFTVFWVDAPKGDHTLRVFVDSRLQDSINQPWYDFLQYGGIVRPVVLHDVPASSMIENVDVIQRDDATRLRFRIHRFDESRPTLRIRVTSDDLPHPLELDVDEHNLEHAVNLTGKRWSPESPNLVVLKMEASEEARGSSFAQLSGSSGLSVRVGLRHVSACRDDAAQAARVCLDGKPVKLLGMCMHNLDVHSRFTVPREKIEQNLRAAKNAGANFLRLVHYPHDLLTLELADELGLLLWTETLGWGNHMDDLSSKSFSASQVSMLDEAVVQTYNHPSVVLYGFLNEGDDDNHGACDIYSKLASRYRDHWKVSGLVTWASNKYQNDRCLASADVISFNDYPGWYTGSVATIGSEMDGYAKWAEDTYRDKPVIIAEVGAAALPESERGSSFVEPPGQLPRGAQIGHWSEDYQAQVDGGAAEAVVCDKRIAGVSLWELFDTRTGELRQPLRPRGFNNKGLLREDGTPKEAYDVVKKAFTHSCQQ